MPGAEGPAPELPLLVVAPPPQLPLPQSPPLESPPLESPPLESPPPESPPLEPPKRVEVAQPRPARLARRLLIGVDAAFSALFASEFAPGAIVGVTLRPSRSPFGGRLSLLAAGARTLPLAPGEVWFTRAAVALGAVVEGAPRGVHLSASLELALGGLIVGASGFTSNETRSAFDLGLAAEARIGWRRGPVTPFVGASARVWLLPTRMVVEGAGEASIPIWEAGLTAGLVFSLSWRPHHGL
jgi:hypothetical protein